MGWLASTVDRMASLISSISALVRRVIFVDLGQQNRAGGPKPSGLLPCPWGAGLCLALALPPPPGSLHRDDDPRPLGGAGPDHLRTTTLLPQGEQPGPGDGVKSAELIDGEGQLPIRERPLILVALAHDTI